MVNDSKMLYCLVLFSTCLGLSNLFGSCEVQKKYERLDKKFTATAESLKVYKATLQNQGFYIPLRKDVNQLKEYTEGFFEGSEENFKDFSEDLDNLRQRVESLEKRAAKK